MNFKTNIKATRTQPWLTWSFAVAIGMAISGILHAQAQPANDQCTGAVEMTLDTSYVVDVSTATSTNEAAPACQPSFTRGVWYKFAPPTNGTYVVSTCGSDFDTVLAVYFGNCSFLNPVSGGCNDNDGPICEGSQASVAFTGEGGLTYWIL